MVDEVMKALDELKRSRESTRPLATKARPRIASEIVPMAHGQEARTAVWRWGKEWRLPDGRHGYWIVNTIRHVAVRCEYDDGLEVIDASDFMVLVEDAADREELDLRDAYLDSVVQHEAAAMKRRQSRKARKAAPLAAAVEAQLAQILEDAP